ncbi:MAG: SDR family NAD(P)-dependent oxidoreductase [Natronomonas sp.]|jgi:NAD(P)-dependent dehydrogenase (short-subunit alcohol dehydrogenase family)|uniref:SDR family NAD(P)-dependent oxidoreductase n=1 Tax=Natronomonas sp. TaxID=2184060 RepID=UPI00286FD412|nr:SDR family NAD(P)-dependent oxidoreductase [Natronomonas sp.]MDR9381096.1 SDR family NAD(P)-dependent oxidoreductase [Natronomonas sp.]MDR9430158.1 SDR family NAD(P)-dependent oxidoreductase [Natronomonas sp.]
MELDLSGRTAVVTGGSRGIGRAITLGFADAGANVVPLSRTESDVEAVVGEVRERGVDSRVETLDVADTDAVEACFDRIDDNLGIDVVVNNAGINPASALGDPEDVSDEGFELVTDVNLGGAFACARAAESPLKASGGVLINVASVGGLVGLPRQHPYVASKHGLVGLTKSLALDWAPNVRVNCLAPGYVATDLTTGLQENDDLRASIERRTPLDRFADPEEIAGPAVFLASDLASYATGETFAVDGGWTAR